jgi:AcrR family transcriptional regulator
MPDKRRPPKDASGSTKERIQSVANALFEEFGYNNTSISMICEKAGVSKTALHYYFPKKQDLFWDMQNYFHAEFTENFHKIVEQETFTKQIWEFFQIMCEGDLYYGVNVTRHYFTLRLEEHSERDFIHNIYHRNPLIAVIKSAQNAGQIKSDDSPENICEALSFAMRGVILTWTIEDGDFDLISYSKKVVRSIIRPAEGYDF